MNNPLLEASYAQAQAVTAEHGRTYYLGSRLLPADRRRAVYALYGFARMVDDWVDDGDDPAGANAAVDHVDTALMEALRGGPVVDDRLLAVVDTARRFDIRAELFSAFLDSMRMDIPGNPLFRDRYRTFAELDRYVYGSAAVIGLQMLPILGTVQRDSAYEEAEAMATALGTAFQLTNFIRDIGEDLDRGRIYLPLSEWEAFGVDESMLRACRDSGRSTRQVSDALAHLIAVTRAIYRRAEPGIELLAPASRPGIRVAFELYRDILREVEAADFHILGNRVTVGRARRVRRAAVALVRMPEPGRGESSPWRGARATRLRGSLPDRSAR